MAVVYAETAARFFEGSSMAEAARAKAVNSGARGDWDRFVNEAEL